MEFEKAIFALDDKDWSQATPEELIHYIIKRFHDLHRLQLPVLEEWSRKVERVHETHPNCPHGLAEQLMQMRQELESHMQKEENVLFPMLQRKRYVSAKGPISVLLMEHDDQQEAMAHILLLTNEITAPQDACGTWSKLYMGLAKFKKDLEQHIYLENTFLFQERADIE